MKLLRHTMVCIVTILTILFGTQVFVRENTVLDSFVLDAISAATDGSECLEPSWIGCSVGWLEKGYTYDQAKGYYVKPSGSTTKATSKTNATITTVQTTKQVTTVTSKPTSTTKPSLPANTTSPTNTTSPAKPSSPSVTSTVKTNVSIDQVVATTPLSTSISSHLGESTTVSYTKRIRPERTTGASINKIQSNSSFGLSFLSGVSMEWVAGGLAIILVMVVEFFIVRAIYKKDK